MAEAVYIAADGLWCSDKAANVCICQIRFKVRTGGGKTFCEQRFTGDFIQLSLSCAA